MPLIVFGANPETWYYLPFGSSYLETISPISDVFLPAITNNIAVRTIGETESMSLDLTAVKKAETEEVGNFSCIWQHSFIAISSI
jgi:hypothetical protein